MGLGKAGGNHCAIPLSRNRAASPEFSNFAGLAAAIFCPIEKIAGAIMTATWNARDYTRAEAARLCGLPLTVLATITHRARHVAMLFSEKRKGRRWFSIRDICVLRVAHELERGGRSWLNAIAIAFEHLEHPPPREALLVLTPAPVRGSGRPVMVTTMPTIERPTLLIPIGRIVHEIMESPSVAVQ